MTKDQKNNANFFNGTSRQERRLRALMPENLRIDARELQDLLIEIYATAQRIRFAEPEFPENSTWAAFLEKSPAFLLASILSNRPDAWMERIRKIIRIFYISGKDNESQSCIEAARVIMEMFLLIDDWYSRSVAMIKWKEKTPMNIVLEQAIQTELQPAFLQFRRLIATLEKRTDTDALSLGIFDKMHPLWQAAQPLKDSQPTNGNDEGRPLLMVIEQMRQLFQRLHFTMTLLGKKAEGWFADWLDNHHDHDPQIGLLLSFLQLFLYARDQLNAKPAEHLDYYYFDILKQQLKAPVPDRTVVCFQLADHVKSLVLEKNTPLLAAVNAAGIPSVYTTDEDLFVSNVSVAELRTVHVAKSNLVKTGSSYKLVSGIYAAPVANSRDGLGKPFTGVDRSWPPFGEEQLDKAPSERQMVDAQIGFILASPVLALQEGERTIRMRFEFSTAPMTRFFDLIEDISHNTDRNVEDVAGKIFLDALLIDVSTPAGWFRINRWQVDTLAAWKSYHGITITAFMSVDDPPLADNDPATTGKSFDTRWPLVRICLNPDADLYLYSFLSGLDLEVVSIETEVKGLKNLNLNSDLGPLDGSAPFMPFGPIPVRNSTFLFGNAELFRKRLTDLSVHLEWNRVPDLDGGFAEYYKAYDQEINNDSFMVRLSALSSYNFHPAEAKWQQSFNLFSSEAPDAVVSSHQEIKGIQLSNLRLNPDYSLQHLAPYSNTARSGYFRLQLAEPARAFGHGDYQRLFTAYLLAQAKPARKPTEELTAPNEPFVPVINRIYVDYKASTVMNLRALSSQENDEAAAEKIISLHPFGHQEIYAGGKGLDQGLLPRLEEDGYLYIGLSDVLPGKPLTLYFQIRESKIKQKPWGVNVTGSYLTEHGWEPFKQEQTLSNSTRGFATSGIVRLVMPEQTTLNHTLLPSGLFWIRVAAKGNLEPIGRIIQVHPHAVEAVWVNNGDETHFDAGMVLPGIQGLLHARSEIAAVIQPAEFYGQSPRETFESFYVRTSERLRHKNRAVSIWDIERMVLAAFPFIRKVKCITPMADETILPGQIKVVVIPEAPVTEVTPMLGFYQLTLIRQFLENKLDPFVQVQVVNPVYEKIKVTCSILLVKGLEHEKGKYLQLLHDDLLDFICPWLKSGAIQMDTSISKNEMLAFINGRPYIRFVTGFSMVHIFEDDDEQYTLTDTADLQQSNETLRASTPWSILTPVELHQIEFLNQEDYLLPDVTAIDEMRLGTDFVIAATSADLPVSTDQESRSSQFDDSEESFLIPKT